MQITKTFNQLRSKLKWQDNNKQASLSLEHK